MAESERRKVCGLLTQRGKDTGSMEWSARRNISLDHGGDPHFLGAPENRPRTWPLQPTPCLLAPWSLGAGKRSWDELAGTTRLHPVMSGMSQT